MTGDGGMLDYFDQSLLKNWAEPQHWKLRKAVRRPSYFFPIFVSIFDTTTVYCLADIATEATAASKPKRGRRHSRLTFITDEERSEGNPERWLIRSCPQLRMRGQRASLNENSDGKVDESFWAQARVLLRRATKVGFLLLPFSRRLSDIRC
jgi:condensin complex subunit 2